MREQSSRVRELRVVAILLAVASGACESKPSEGTEPEAASARGPESRPDLLRSSRVDPTRTRAAERQGPSSSDSAPRELYVPTPDLAASGEVQDPAHHSARRCPPEMVSVRERFCIDRYEVTLEERKTGAALSPHYPPTPLAARLHADWVERAPRSRGRLGLLPVPEAAPIELLQGAEVRAISRAGVLPQGYLSKVQAARACEGAGKRLCSEFEWVTACSGELVSQFPYGERYEPSACNVHRSTHPAVLLHGSASEHHLDPRLGLTYDQEGPLLRRTGASPRCQSRWGEDAVFDMVGNIDEWVDAPGAVFAGGFFSRATTQGCLARISSHLPDYFDYSLGTRCCWSPSGTLTPDQSPPW